MEKSIIKKLKIKIKNNNICSHQCPYYNSNKCLLNNEVLSNNERTILCKSIFNNNERVKKTFLYDLSVETFYNTALNTKNIEEASESLGVSTSTLKWFLYSVFDSKDPKIVQARNERVCAFFDGQNEAKKKRFLGL